MVRHARRCPSLQQMAGYLDGTLDPAAAFGTSAHLRTCRGCRELLREVVPALAWSWVADLHLSSADGCAAGPFGGAVALSRRCRGCLGNPRARPLVNG